MPKKIRYALKQANFFDFHPALTPWPKLLADFGLNILYKPREVFWKIYIDNLDLKKGERVLDIGSGQGVMLARLQKTYHIKGVGVDISQKSIEYAKKEFSRRELSFMAGDATSLPFTDSSFDVVISFDALEHIKDQEKALREMSRVLKPRGKLLLYTMSKNYEFTLDWIWESLGFDIFSKAAHKKELFLDPDWLERYLKDKGLVVREFGLFDSMFSLALDEAIMVMIWISRSFNLFRYQKLGEVFLYIANFVSRVSFPLVNLLDFPWYFFKKSLSFCLIGEKK